MLMDKIQDKRIAPGLILLAWMLLAAACGSDLGDAADGSALTALSEPLVEVDTEEAFNQCDTLKAPDRYGEIEVLSAEIVSAGDYVSYQDERSAGKGAQAALLALSATENVTACLIRGAFAAPGGPPDAANRTGVRDLAIVVVHSRGVTLDVAGFSDAFIEMPSAFFDDNKLRT